MFSPGDRAAARNELGISPDAQLLLFVGRIQPLKAPDVLVRAAAEIIAADPQAREKLVVAVVGGPSGTGLERPDSLIELARELAIADLVRLEPPSSRERLAQWFRAADLTVVPSYNESFGLVAVESQACGTPVVAANVGGLPTAVNDGVSGVLVDGHNPADWARVIASLLADPNRLAAMRVEARAHAENFGWEATTEALLDVYSEAMTDHHQRPARVSPV
jgi:D-inositol-3-phosphate glycosyltransferase